MNTQGELAASVAAEMRACGDDQATGPMVLDALAGLNLKLMADDDDLALKAFVGDPDAESDQALMALKARMWR